MVKMETWVQASTQTLKEQTNQIGQIITQLQESKQDPHDKFTTSIDILKQLHEVTIIRANMTSRLVEEYAKLYKEKKELEQKYDELVQRNIHGWVC